MTRIKVLAYGDAGQSTGFERVYREVLDWLHNSGHYDVVGYGLGFNGNPDYKYSFPVYPAELRGDYFGFDGVVAACKRHKPDIIWTVQDIWNHLNYVVRKPIDVPYVAYFPVDTPNIKWSHAMGCGAVAQPVAYTAFGASETAASIRHAVDIMHKGLVLRDLNIDEPRTWVSLPHPETTDKLNLRLDYLARWQNLENWAIIPHGLDKKRFHQLDKALARKEFQLGEGEFIVGSINTNQFRKQQDRVMRIFAAAAQKLPMARLLLYCNNNNESGYDLHQYAAYLGISDKCYFVHDFVQNISDDDLNVLYNTCDVMINAAGGEGWGLTSFEGAAAGVPQMVPDWSATRELWKNHGVLMPVSDWRCEPRHLNTCHALVDVRTAAKQLMDVAVDAKYRESLRDMALANAAQQLSWEEVGKRFAYVLRKTLGTFGSPTPMSFKDVISARKGVVESELSRAAYIDNVLGAAVKA